MSAPLRVLLVRTSSLGDVVHTLPVLSALRRSWPSARIAWVVEEAYVPMLEGHPDLDVILPVALRRWRRSPLRRQVREEVATALARLSDFGADLALDLMGSFKGAALAAASYAPRRIGLRFADRREGASALFINEPCPARGAHAVERQLSLLLHLGIGSTPVVFEGEKLFRRHGASLPPEASGEPFVYIHPGAAWGNKQLPASTWRAVAVLLRRRLGLRVLVGSGPGEEDLAREVAAHDGAEVVGARSLAELGAVARQARLFLGGDTGPVHLAHALGTPVVCVMGPTDPERHGPYGSPASVVSLGLPCSPCHRRMDDSRACLVGIRPEQIADAAVRLLAPRHEV